DGKGEDGRTRTREDKLAVFFTQDKLDDDGYPVRDRDSSSYIAAFEPASVFAGLVKAEGIRSPSARRTSTTATSMGSPPPSASTPGRHQERRGRKGARLLPQQCLRMRYHWFRSRG